MTEESFWDKIPPKELPPFKKPHSLLETAVETVVSVFNTLNPLHKEPEND